MARARKYGKKSSEKVERTMHEFKRGTLRSGRSGKKVTGREQAIAIGLSQARRAGGKVPPPPRGHATKKKSRAQLDREIAAALSGGSGQVKLKDRYSGGHAWLTVRDGRVVGAMGSDPKRYVGLTIDEAKHHARYGGKPRHSSSSHATRRQVGPHADRGDRVLADLQRWGIDRAQIDEVRAAFRAGDHRRAMALAKDLGRNRAARRGRAGSYHATRRQAGVEVDTSVYRRYHGAEPRGFGDWTFVIGKREYERSDDPALYRPAVARGAQKAGRTGLSFARAKEYAIAEAKRRGTTVVGVAP